jgi:hypothetical protein
VIVVRRPNGDLTVPRRAEGDNGVIGDGVERIDPDHPDYADWIAAIERGSVELRAG